MTIFRGRWRWLLISWMFAISAIAYLDHVNISIAGRSIEQENGLEHLQLGWEFSTFILGYALFQTPGGRRADRFGPSKVLALRKVWWALISALTALVYRICASGVAPCINDVVKCAFLTWARRSSGISG
jgi:ACS family glucarate transporter-like MFS transporter